MRYLGHDLKALLLVVCGLFGALGALAQSAPVACPPAVAPAADQSASVAAAARSSKKPAVHAKKIIDDDDMALHHGPIPRLMIEGSDNTAEIIAAIKRYKESHTPQQTEKALHDWFDETNDLLTVTRGKAASCGICGKRMLTTVRKCARTAAIGSNAKGSPWPRLAERAATKTA